MLHQNITSVLGQEEHLPQFPETMRNIRFLFHGVEVEDFVPSSLLRFATLTILLRCELYFLKFHIEKCGEIMVFQACFQASTHIVKVFFG
jgi:hypothetical protein